MSETLTGAARFRQMMASRERKIIDVKAPSGFVYKRFEPCKYTILFDDGNVPQSAATLAVQEWEKQGIIQPTDTTQPIEAQSPASPESESKVNKMMKVRDRVLTDSVDPKLVTGTPKNENEISIEMMMATVPEDVEFLVQFEAAGGDASAMLAMFPKGREQHALASAATKKQRHAGK